MGRRTAVVADTRLGDPGGTVVRRCAYRRSRRRSAILLWMAVAAMAACPTATVI